jgi:hypothetical protein
VWSVLPGLVRAGGPERPAGLPSVEAGGIRWTGHFGVPAFLRSVIPWEGGFLGIAGPFPDTTLAFSPDGIEWARWVAQPTADPVAVWAAGSVVVVAGSPGTGDGPEARWSSADGVTWAAGGPDPETPPDGTGPVAGATVHSSAAAGGGRIALGTDAAGRGTAWVSLDGAAWDEAPAAVAASVIARPAWYVSPAYGTGRRVFVQGRIDLPDPLPSCPACTVTRPIVWVGEFERS